MDASAREMHDERVTTADRPNRHPTVWNAAPGVQSGDGELLAEWRTRHPASPWRGQDGGGGFLGWANRLDERVARGGYLMSPRSEIIPITQREMWREVLRSLKDWRVLVAYSGGIVLAAIVAPVLVPVVMTALAIPAAARVRNRRRAAFLAELHADQ